MKNKIVLFLLAGTTMMQSCATVFGGHIDECQKERPERGEPRRKIRPVALAADIITSPIITLPVDFATGAIYKPCDSVAKGYSNVPKMQYLTTGYSIKGANDLYISDGVISMNQIRGWVGPPVLGGYISEPHLQTGAAFLTYRHFLSERFAVGVTGGIDNEEGDLSYGNPKISAAGVDAVSGHYNVHAYSLAIEALLIYSKSEEKMLYGYLGGGATYFDDKCVIFSYAPFGPPVVLPSNPYDYHSTVYNFQFTPIGIRYGGKTAVFFELGFGYKGIFSGGFSVRL